MRRTSSGARAATVPRTKKVARAPCAANRSRRRSVPEASKGPGDVVADATAAVPAGPRPARRASVQSSRSTVRKQGGRASTDIRLSFAERDDAEGEFLFHGG